MVTNLFQLDKPVGPTKPQGLTVVLAHNRESHTILERSLIKAGIFDYEVARIDPNLKWRHVLKVLALYELLKNMKKKTEYVLYIDSDDAVIRDNPVKSVEILKQQDCEILFSISKWAKGYHRNKESKHWAKKLAMDSGKPGYFLNSGVYVGRRESVIELYEAMIPYIPNSSENYYPETFDCVLSKKPVRLPKDKDSDQRLFRYLHPRFHPRLKLDFDHKLAFRS